MRSFIDGRVSVLDLWHIYYSWIILSYGDITVTKSCCTNVSKARVVVGDAKELLGAYT